MAGTEIESQAIRDLLSTPLTFAEARGISDKSAEDITYVSSPYTVLQGDEKAQLIGVPFYVTVARETVDRETDRPYVILYLVTEKDEMYIVTDGSTGIFAQVSKAIEDRVSRGVRNPTMDFLVPNGLRVSEYGLNADNRPAAPGEKVTGKARTYYLA